MSESANDLFARIGINPDTDTEPKPEPARPGTDEPRPANTGIEGKVKMIEVRIPAKEQYAYIQLNLDDNSTTEFVKKKYDEFTQVFNPEKITASLGATEAQVREIRRLSEKGTALFKTILAQYMIQRNLKGFENLYKTEASVLIDVNKILAGLNLIEEGGQNG